MNAVFSPPPVLPGVPAAGTPDPAGRRGDGPWSLFGLPVLVAGLLILVWDRVVAAAGDTLIPRPWQVVLGLKELAENGLLHKYVISSMFRVLWGFALAVVVGVPLGLLMGWFKLAYRAFNPLLQLLRPISPIAWIPLAIIWFGVSEMGSIFLIALSSVFPITVSAAAAVKNIQPVYVQAARNFGLSTFELFRRVILPATMPQILTGLRITLGIAWMVVVAAEMIVVDPRSGGLGYLIIDARNAGSRYDLVVAAMAVIGVIGLGLDLVVRRLERFDEVRWGRTQR